MRYVVSVVLLLSALWPTLGQSSELTYREVGGLTCGQFRSLLGTPQYLEASQVLSDHMGAQGRVADAFGSSCNLMDYVKAECSLARDARVREAVDALIAKAQRGATLPRIPRCGA